MYQHSACWILFLTLQPRPATRTILLSHSRESFSPFSSPPPFPVKAAYWETPAPPSPPWTSPPGTTWLWRECGRWGRPAAGSPFRSFFTDALKMSLQFGSSSKTSLFTIVKSLPVTRISASLRAHLSFSAWLQAEHFAYLGLVCLVSGWVLRGERDSWHLRHPLKFSRNGTGNICAFPPGVIVRV